ncbi:MAG: CoA-binding protein [Patescibacteria group bacterium]|jgi:predicted CoA-binding protein|nr:CoA-binding protein [Patescibacteria group bacterium]
MIDKNFTYAIVGASNNKDKYGYKVLHDLIDAGYNTIPINPKETKILNLETYPSISDYEGVIDVVVFVVPPVVTEKVLEEALLLGISKVWMQPGSESEKAINFCNKHKISYIYNACIMLNKK